MPPKSSTGHQKKKKKTSQSPSPQKVQPTTTLTALFKKQLQQQQQQHKKHQQHLKADDSTSRPGESWDDGGEVEFVREERKSPYFSSHRVPQESVYGPQSALDMEGGGSQHTGNVDLTAPGRGLRERKKEQPQLKTRLSHRLSLKKGSHENEDTKEGGSEEVGTDDDITPVTLRSDGDGRERCPVVSSKSLSVDSSSKVVCASVTSPNLTGASPVTVHTKPTLVDSKSDLLHSISSPESEGCVGQTATSVSGSLNKVDDSVVQQNEVERKGVSTSSKCKRVGDRNSSSKGKLSLKRKQTWQEGPQRDASSPKSAKVSSSTGNSSALAPQEDSRSSDSAPVFSIFRQSAEQVKSETTASCSVTPSPTQPKTTDSQPVSSSSSSSSSLSSSSSSSMTHNAKTRQGAAKKMPVSRHSRERSSKKGKRGPNSQPSSSEDGGEGAGERGGEIDNNDDNDDEDGVKEEEGEEGLYRVPYYLENFNTIVKSVFADDYYVKLFSKEDLHYVETFNTLPEPCQKLYVRLFGRKLSWLTEGKIRYPDIADSLAPCLHDLVNTGLLSSGEDLDDLSAILAALSAPDLRSLAKSYHINPAGQTKGQITLTLLAKSQQSTVASLFGQKIGGVKVAMVKKAKQLLGPVYRLVSEARAVFVRAMMLFSLINTSSDDESGGQAQLFQMLLVNIGRVVYPSYTVNRKTNIFSSRQDLIRFEEALQLESELLGHTTSGHWKDAYSSFLTVRETFARLEKDSAILEWDKKLPDFLRRYTAGSVLVRLLSQGIEILQRRKDYGATVTLIRSLLAQHIYGPDLRGYWWDRLALDLDVHLKQQAQALQAIEEGLGDPAVRTGHRLSLYLRAETICSRPKSPYRHRLPQFVHDPLLELPKTTVEGRVLPHTLPGAVRYQFITNACVGEGGDEVTMCNVEQVVLDHYRANGFPQGIHAEGSVVTSLFCLLLWDAVFMDVSDAFHSPYQTCPLDQQTDDFYLRRKTVIDDRLAFIECSNEETLQAMVSETWERHYGVMCAGINWECFTSLAEVQGLVRCVGGVVLAGILGRYARQPRHTRSGFPDLTLWNTATKQLKICEVKGPGDRLSHKQMMWLDHLLKLGVDAEVCHVKPVGVKKLKPAARPEFDTV